MKDINTHSHIPVYCISKHPLFVYPWHLHSDLSKVFGVFLRSLSSAELGASPKLFGQACSATKISPGPHRAQMASQLGLSRLTVYYRRFCDGRSASEGELRPWGERSETQRMPWLLSGLLPGETIGSGTRLQLQQEVMCVCEPGNSWGAVAWITEVGSSGYIQRNFRCLSPHQGSLIWINTWTNADNIVYTVSFTRLDL